MRFFVEDEGEIFFAAGKDGNNYLVVAMKAPLTDSEGNITYYHLDDAKSLFDWAFNNFSYQVVLAESAELGELPVRKTKSRFCGMTKWIFR